VIQNWSHVLSAPRRAGIGMSSFGVSRHAPDQVRHLATELAGWTSGELPGGPPASA
jgi:hypothetical protein